MTLLFEATRFLCLLGRALALFPGGGNQRNFFVLLAHCMGGEQRQTGGILGCLMGILSSFETATQLSSVVAGGFSAGRIFACQDKTIF